MYPLLTLCSLLLGLLFFNTLRVNAANSTTWTFNGLAHIRFTPHYTDNQNIHLGLKFRTRQPNGLLFYHYLKNYDSKKLPLLTSYELFAELRQGYVRVGNNFNQYSDVVPIGSALNNDRWHKLEVLLDPRTGEITVTLDRKKQAKILEAFQRGGARDLLKWSQIQSEISYGGTAHQSHSEFFYFVGCLSNLQYAGVDGKLIPVPIDNVASATEGCSDLCKGRNPCENGGQCVNLYTQTRCDCFGTQYEGDLCQRKEPTVMTFRGYEWVTYQLYEKKEDRLVADKSRISFEFKTERGNGVLLYAVGGTPFHTHITASIHVGNLHVSVAVGDTELEFTMGLGLDNGRWHNVTISHSKRDIDVFLDNERHHKTINGSEYFITLDPKVYFGGGHNFVETKGLKVTQSFVGCMRNVYFNDFSILYGLRTADEQCAYHGGPAPEFKCDPTQEIPITFPKASSMLRHRTPEQQNLTVSFQFKTVRKDALLFHVGLISRKESGGYNFGFIEIWVKSGLPLLYFSPSMDPAQTQNLTIPSKVNNAQWHRLELTLKESKIWMNVDDVSRTTERYTLSLRQRGKIVLGYGLRRYKSSEGFVGCMQAITIQNKKLDPITTAESNDAVGIKLDGCHLIDYCANENICEHNSECLSDWDGVQCACPEHYEGKACHFSKYPRTCDYYYRSGRNTSGVYLIDLDGSGNLDPVYVQCHMDKRHGGYLYGETVINHNFQKNTTVRGSEMSDVRYHLSYREMGQEQLRTLTRYSLQCRQHVEYRCNRAPLLLGKKTWFQAANGEIVDYIGSRKSGFCDCDGQDTCDGERCYCDHGSDKWSMDSGANLIKSQLPLMDITVLQSELEYLQGEATLTLGPLKCWGNAAQPLDKSITFTQEQSFIRLRPWVQGNLHLSFKTHQTNALLLYQNYTDLNPNRLSIKIIGPHQVSFNFFIHQHHISHTLYTSKVLDGDDWHSIDIERDPYNIRLTLDETQKLIEIPYSRTYDEYRFDGLLFVGGITETLAEKIGETTPGFTGCIRGLMYNGGFQDLEKSVDGSLDGISVGCMSSCWPNPCANGGTCEESWGSYTCKCQERWSHHGLNCEHDINRDSVTLDGNTNLRYNMTNHPEILNKTIILSFRTYEPDALLLYAHDQLNNFVQLHLADANTITISFNSYKSIIKESFTVKDKILNDGQWKQIIAEDFYNFTRLHVLNETRVIQVNRFQLQKYESRPFRNSLAKEDINIPRPTDDEAVRAPFVHLYVGGVNESVTYIPQLRGCIRGLKIGNVVVNLGEKAREYGNNSGAYPECKAGCHDNACFKGGYCEEQWKDAEFICDCSESAYAGTRCEIEPCVNIDGNTLVKYNFTLLRANQHTSSEQLSLTFKTTFTTTDDLDDRLLTIVYVQSTKTKDYVIVWYEPSVNSRGSVVVETNQAVGIYRMKVTGDFANGQPHRMIYKREGSEMFLKVEPIDKNGFPIIDDVKEAKFGFPDFNLDNIDTISIGGVDNTSDLSRVKLQLVNFTGTISNVVFNPKSDSDERIAPLKSLYNKDKGAFVLGDELEKCSESLLTKLYVTDTPPIMQITVKPYEKLTMPPWNIGTAKVDIIGNRIMPSTTPLTTTPSTPPLTNLTAPVVQGRIADDLTVAIAVSIIAALLIIAIIIALLLCRQRKRQDYDIKKEHDMEMKQPLNHNHYSVQPSPVPPDHLAKLDEFSMVSATLGPRPPKRVPPPEVPNRFSQGSFPLMDEEFPNVIYSRKKKRPASSISEVLEEMERRQKAKDEGLDPDAESPVKCDNRNHGEGELDWDPTADTTPLTCGDITFFNSPLLLTIPDENEEIPESSTSPSSSHEKQEDDEDEKSPDDSTHQTSTEYNGDSGYEAESRPENTEEDATPDSTVDIHTPPKMYMYDLTPLDMQDSPSLNDPSRRLLASEVET